MTSVATILPNVRMDFAEQTETRTDITAAAWQEGVNQTLKYLYYAPPNTTSKAVLGLYVASGKTVLITPERQPFPQACVRHNASSNPEEPEKATLKGETPEKGRPGSGIGGGSDSRITFTAQDWSPVSEANNIDVCDEVLLHEFVHALRQSMGTESGTEAKAPFARQRSAEEAFKAKKDTLKCEEADAILGDKHAQSYETLEEFIAVLVANIYRSENGRAGLVRDHAGDYVLAPPMTNPRNFLTVWRTQIARMCNEMPRLCDRIAVIDCRFNPVFELYAAENRFAAGGRAVKTGAAARRFHA